VSALRIIPACVLLASIAARAAEPTTLEAAPRFVDFHTRAGLLLGVGGAGPVLSATGIFGQLVAVDVSGIYLPWPGSDVPIAFGAVQAGVNFRYDSRTAAGIGNVTDFRLMAGADVTTAELDIDPGRTVYVPGFICSAVLEWTKWIDRSLGAGAELAATAGYSPSAGGGVGLRASVGVAF